MRLGLTITHPRAPRLETCAAHHAASYSLLFTHTEPPPLSEDSAEAVCRYASVGWQSLAFRPCALSHSTTATMLSLLSYSDCTRPLWPQRRNLLSALYPASPAPYMPRSVLHTTPPHPNRRYPLPALTRCQTLHYALRLPRAAFQKHIWPFRFNGLKPLGHLSTYTGARLKTRTGQ